MPTVNTSSSVPRYGRIDTKVKELTQFIDRKMGLAKVSDRTLLLLHNRIRNSISLAKNSTSSLPQKVGGLNPE
ncbi:hypothetical protein PS865_04462 [Pseudomonas fluorescens]|uniref:hypothetical protein n=1 Tax=Pseudomonas fluorescens TaxID=294 RepID=UPI00123FE11D|nr:hypothetical protein [Pseudomonas fluorescens]VVP33036.1 hypothetical protein PS865_04462 [Pseudomonas fluorescens]